MTKVAPVTPVVTPLDLIFEFSNESLLPRSKWDEQQHRRRRGRQHAVNGKARLAGLLHQSDIDCAKYVQTSCRLYCLRWCCLAGAWHDTRRRLCRQYCLPALLPARPPPTPVRSFLYKMPLYSHDRLGLNSKNWAEAYSHFLHAMWSLLGLMCFTLVAVQAKDGLDYTSDVNLPMLMNHLCKFYSYRVIRTLTYRLFFNPGQINFKP